ncbi:hypothetical protein DSECCO2_522630 [anaerobic digester metagenome]
MLARLPFSYSKTHDHMRAVTFTRMASAGAERRALKLVQPDQNMPMTRTVGMTVQAISAQTLPRMSAAWGWRVWW